ncbi:MAG: peptidylprolyl isomerase [Rhizobacter sp.]|nr:peptidylprolyl isomerase [Rhizobacter sp.]
MKKLSPAARASLLALSVALLSPLAAQAQNVAIVNGKPVPKARVDMLLEQATKQGGQPRTPELEQQVRDEVVLREMFMQEAEKQGLARSPDYKAQLELARQSLLIRELFADYGKKHPVTDAEAQAEYDKYKAQASGTEYHARHILVDSEDEAKSLIKEIKAGGKFDELAKKHSKDQGSGANGGDLDWANPNSYVPEFAKALSALKKGEMTETPVKTQYGYHIIKLEDTREAQFPSFDEVKARIQQGLAQQKLAKYRDEIKAKAKTDYKFTTN